MKAVWFRVPVLAIVPLLAAAALLTRTGGWAIATFDPLPEYLVAGEPVELSFTLRAHGSTPLSALMGQPLSALGSHLLASGAGMGQSGAALEPAGGAGRFRAVLTPTRAGDLTLTLHIGVLSVGNARLLPIPVVEPGDGAAPPRLAAPERGKRAFVSAGCVGCHAHEAFHGMGYRTLPVGPDLSGRSWPGSYLARLLADPASVRPAGAPPARMPNLELDADEITALVAFLNDGSVREP